MYMGVDGSGDLSDDGLDRGGYGHKGHHWPHKRPGRWWSGDLTMQMGVDGSGDLSDDGLDRWGYGRPGHHWPYTIGPTDALGTIGPMDALDGGGVMTPQCTWEWMVVVIFQMMV